ncbi:MAG: hypothetical protein EPN93_06035 [Spirochaetes bacterium]|nr:MAG: hypothetical protein EPN93_06035 [Spirochaetota bacterium]
MKRNIKTYFLFNADDGTHGFELWISDTTEAGTKLLKDINTDTNKNSGKSNPVRFTYMNGKVYFSAYDSVNGRDLWVSDGTETGTHIVKALNTTLSEYQSPLTVMNGKLYYGVHDTSDPHLFATDGTVNGTQKVSDVIFDVESAYAITGKPVVMNNKLYFRGVSGSHWVLYVSDGTSAGTAIVKDKKYAGIIDNPQYMTVVGNKLFFSAADGGTYGNELWVIDGSAAADEASMVKDIKTGTGSSNPKFITAMNGKAYFQAADISANGLWVSDGTESGTSMIVDANTVTKPTSLTVLNNKLYFFATNYTTASTSFFMSDGTTAGTESINVNELYVTLDEKAVIATMNNKLFFKATWVPNGTNDVLCMSDATAAGTAMLKDITPGTASGSTRPGNFLVVKDSIYFSALDGTNRYELWVSDGTEDGTKLFKNINPSGNGDLLTDSY